MKIISTLFFLFIFLLCQHSMGQSNPVALKPGITINRILTVQNGSIRVIKDPISKNLFYSTTDGRIYEVHQPQGSAAYDSLVFTTTDHHVTYAQGFTVHDSTFYISGNDSSNKPLTFGIIVRGVLQPNGTRTWSTVLQTDFYQTADYFDHLFSGIAVNPAGDSIVICSGARGDHGEVETRYGLYPGLRNVPLTTNLYIVPAHDTGIVVLHNDSAWIDTSVNVFARGIRNTFDMAYDAQGRLFGVENSGDRDHNEEMNWLRRGRHYGFPWKMGDTENPQQFPGFVPGTDPLIPHYSRSWRIGAWSNDPTYPPLPAGIIFTDPIQNFGPDADKYRDTITGTVMDASDSSISIGTFTAHRSPLGLVFDNDSVMHPDYRGDAFMLSWTKGLDSCGCTAIPDTAIGPFVDPSEDLLHLDLAYDTLSDKFTLHATRIVEAFEHPVDDDIDSNKIYVLENGYGGTSGLFEILMPYIPVCAPAYSVAVNYSSCDSAIAIASPNATGYPPYIYKWLDSLGNFVQTDTLSTDDSLWIFTPGSYAVDMLDSFGCHLLISFIVHAPVQLNVDLQNPCDTSTNFSVAYANGTGPFTYEWRTPDSSGIIIQSHTVISSTDSLFNIAAGNYFIQVRDSLGCYAFSGFTIVDPVQVSVDSVFPTSCIGCSDGSAYFTAVPGPLTLTLNPATGTLLGNAISGLMAGTYTLCGLDSMGCTSCDTFIVLDDPTNTSLDFNRNEFNVFPNPSKGLATVRFRSRQASIVTLNLFDATGRKTEIPSDEKYCNAGENIFLIDTKEIPPGCYYIELRSSVQSMIAKFVVIKQ
ncbi:MAG: T9SS type A sorting domain-containing protein [Bacteroidota bacterium]